jgi:hypothetical protein
MASAHEPLSWLTLERYALGELSAEERAQVEAQLAESPVDRACLQEILEDRSEISLPGPAPTARVTSLAQVRAARRGRWLALGAALGAAATILLMVRDRHAPAPYDGVKGSDVTLRLISDRQGAEPRSFAAGERFKVEVSCPAQLGASLRLLIFQAGEVFEPLPAPARFACGNRAPWPGAFALDGSAAAEVCLVWGERPPRTRAELGTEAVCTRLEAR